MYIDNEMTTLNSNHSYFDEPEDHDSKIVYTLSGKAVRLLDDGTEVNSCPAAQQ